MQLIQPDEIHNRKILFSALNWGYGHVMRSMILLKKLQNQGNDLYVVCTEEQEHLYRTEKLAAAYILNSGYPFDFGGKGNFAFDLWKNFSALKRHYNDENKLVEKLCDELKINLVLADQSLGFRSNIVPSVLITHQVNLPIRWWQKPVQWLYNKELDKFNFIWIPDQAPPNNLAGWLSETTRKNVSYIGFLSRFDRNLNFKKKFDVGILVTGPQPYAQQFFDEMRKRFENSNLKVFIIYNGSDLRTFKNIEIFQHQVTEKMAELMCSADLLISRSGYSSLMDFRALGIQNVELHATAGQAEQEYMKERWLNMQ